MQVDTYETTVTGSDEPIDITMYHEQGDIKWVMIVTKVADQPAKFLQLDADWFFILLGDTAKEAYDSLF